VITGYSLQNNVILLNDREYCFLNRFIMLREKHNFMYACTYIIVYYLPKMKNV